jgi:PIN domain nuclease of toxin-antitoxin system
LCALLRDLKRIQVDVPEKVTTNVALAFVAITIGARIVTAMLHRVTIITMTISAAVAKMLKTKFAVAKVSASASNANAVNRLV